MVYLTGMAFVILLHLLYLLTSILLFNLLEIGYVQLVKAGLIVFMSKIRDMLIESSTFLHVLMEILILHFCVMINVTFGLIKAKLLFYLDVAKFQIYLDYYLLLEDLEEFNNKLSELKSLVDKYLEILDKVDGMLIVLIELIKDNRKLKDRITGFYNIYKSIKNVQHIFIYQNNKISEIVKDLTPIKLLKTVELTPDKNDVVINLKLSLGNLKEHLSAIINLKSDNTLIVKVTDRIQGKMKASIRKFNGSEVKGIKNGVDPINNFLDTADQEVLKEIIDLIGQLEAFEIINLAKLYKLISEIQLKYHIILVRGHLLLWTIQFYQEIQRTITKLCMSLKLEGCNAREFLVKCSDLEKHINTVNISIYKLIIKLRKSCDNSKCLGVPLELINLYSKIIDIIGRLNFYVDLMILEILIFKNIILTLIVMTVSSFILDSLMLYIFTITDIDSAIKILIDSYWYLKTFYIIQLENTLSIVGLSSALKFSQSIHGYYHVLLYNLQLINGLIWVVECYINHLIVFKFTSMCLNSLIENVAKQLQIVIDIYKVMSSMTTISDKLKSTNKSITELNNIQDGTDITNWKESAKKMRHETQLISRDIGEIDSEITKINGFVRSILSSWATLLSLESFLLVLILQVHIFIKNTDNWYTIDMIIGFSHSIGLIKNVLGPCNKQLILILAYLIDMWVIIVKLIKIVENTILVIYGMLGWLYGLTKAIESSVDKINKGVVDMECAIEAVARNFIRCTINRMSSNLISSTRYSSLEKNVVSMYSLINVMDYLVLVNRMLEFWTFSDQSVELFKYIRYCVCALYFESKYRDQRPSAFLRNSLHSIKISDVNPVSESLRHTMSENLGNHMCLCLVIKYHLRPSLLKCILILRNEELGTLDTISRKYERYNKFGIGSLRWRLCGLVLNIIYELTSLLRNRYTDVLTRKNDSLLYELYNLFTFLANVAHDITYPLHQGIIANLSRCFCLYSDDPYYPYLISTILFVSSLVENIWTMDPKTMRLSIERLSLLYSQLEIYDLNSTSLKPVCCNHVYTLLVNKECQSKDKGKCCCWCVTCYNLCIILIYLSFQFKLFNGITSKKDKCEEWKNFCEVKECNCQCTDKEKVICCLLKLATCSQVSGSGSKAGECKSLEQALEKCCTECGQDDCCKKLKKKLENGLCKLLLLGCQCECTTTNGTSQEVKAKCVFFSDLNERTRVAVVVFCKCAKAGKECCCLTQIIDKLKKKSLDKICEEGQCVCDDLKKGCEDICGTECASKCPCKELKEKFESICKGTKTNCGNGDNCLCKKIKDVIDNSCIKKECKCTEKGGSCKCVCCKLVGASIKILARACISNILEPHIRITLDLLSSIEDKPQLVRSIVNTINQGTVNRIYLVKNTSITHGTGLDTNLENISVRNWGYDTYHEHQPTTLSSNYPNLISNRTGGPDGNKMFKLVLSRMLIAAVIVRMFVYLRISYHQMIVIDSSLDNTDSVNENPKFFI